MNKILLFIIALGCTAFSCYAQTKPAQLSVGGEFGLPTGHASQIYGSVLGASVKLELPVSASKFSFVITSGLSYFLDKYYYSGPLGNGTFVVPIEAGGKYYFSKLGYFEGDFGVSADNYVYKLLDVRRKFENTAFIYSPVIGFSAPTNKHKATIDIGLRYEGRVESGGTIGQVALRLAYRFGLKKLK